MRARTAILLTSAPILLCIALWWMATTQGWVSPLFLPSPSALLRGFVELFTEQGFLRDIGVSTARVFGGFAIAVVLAVPLGMMMGLSRKVALLTEPLVDFIRYTPTPALIPLFILWLGVGEREKLVVIAQTVFFQLVLMVANDVAFVPREYLESSRTLGASRWQQFRHCIFPAILPRLYDDMRICLGWAWTALITAEIVGSSSGIGIVIIQAQRLLRTEFVIAGILTVGFIGLCIDVLMRKLYPVFFPWAPRLEKHA